MAYGLGNRGRYLGLLAHIGDEDTVALCRVQIDAHHLCSRSG